VADLSALQRFAAQNGFGMTAPLTHRQVVELAQYWLPEMRFYEDERFHPITLDDAVSMARATFEQLPPAGRPQWQVVRFVRAGSGAQVVALDPPAVYVPDGVVQPSPNAFVPVVRPLSDGVPVRDALASAASGSSTVVTHGGSFTTSNQFHGAVQTFQRNNTASKGDPFVPRADEPDPQDPLKRRPRITVMAALLNLIDLLKYELAVASATDYPPDGLRHGFDIANSLLRSSNLTLSADNKRDLLKAILAAHEAGGPFPPSLPPGVELDRGAWDALTRYAFLEFYFYYAYNDFERYQTALFDNEHEGDDEGCCLVFDRNVLNLAATSSDSDALKRAVPHSIITSVHEEWQEADLIKHIAPPTLLPNDPRLARELIQFRVYIAGGSHATYFTPGQHDLVDLQDQWGYAKENPAVLIALIAGAALISPWILVLPVILAMIEHFVDTEDYTSDDGVHAGPEDIIGDDPTRVALSVQVLPMSADDHIYQPQHEAFLALRAYAGKWGGQDGVIDKSPPFAPKTGRYFRKLLDNL
jgi:hypothetical protein